MNENDSIENIPASQKIMHVQPPTSGSVVHGMNAQVDLRAAAEVLEQNLIEEIQKRLRKATAAKKKAAVDVTAAVEARDRIVRAYPVAPDLWNDLNAVAQALRKFVPDAFVPAMPSSNMVSVDYGAKLVSASWHVTTARGSSLFTGTRSWAMSDGLVAAHATVVAAQERVALLDRNLQVLRDELENIPRMAKAANAGIVRVGLEKDADGRKVLGVIDGKSAELLSNLDARLADDAPADDA